MGSGGDGSVCGWCHASHASWCGELLTLSLLSCCRFGVVNMGESMVGFVGVSRVVRGVTFSCCIFRGEVCDMDVGIVCM